VLRFNKLCLYQEMLVLGWKFLLGTNTLAYFGRASEDEREKKGFYKIDIWVGIHIFSYELRVESPYHKMNEDLGKVILRMIVRWSYW
jgi:hypothetical protein